MTISELKRLAEAATPGPWEVVGRTGRHVDSVTICDGGKYYGFVADAGPSKDGSPQKDSAFIAAANPQTVLALLDRLAKAEEALAWYASDPEGTKDEIIIGFGFRAREALVELRKPLGGDGE